MTQPMIRITRYRSPRHLDGGSSIVHEASVGPRNLLAAARALPECRRDGIAAHGNLGFYRVALTVGDTEIGEGWLPETLADAREVLTRVAAGLACTIPATAQAEG